jgi:hypothetical protein
LTLHILQEPRGRTKRENTGEEDKERGRLEEGRKPGSPLILMSHRIKVCCDVTIVSTLHLHALDIAVIVRTAKRGRDFMPRAYAIETAVPTALARQAAGGGGSLSMGGLKNRK